MEHSQLALANYFVCNGSQQKLEDEALYKKGEMEKKS